MKACVVGKVGSLLVLSRCSPARPDAPVREPRAAARQVRLGPGGQGTSDELASKIGEYMPPLDGGKLEVAAPKGWDWANPGGEVLVAFKPKDAELNTCRGYCCRPRIPRLRASTT